jgi:hypothetical protein
MHRAARECFGPLRQFLVSEIGVLRRRGDGEDHRRSQRGRP